MNDKSSFFDVLSCLKFKKIRKMFLQEEVFFLNLLYKNFVGNLMSKLARSILTSYGIIRVDCAACIVAAIR
jgi:hypothetical protein